MEVLAPPGSTPLYYTKQPGGQNTRPKLGGRPALFTAHHHFFNYVTARIKIGCCRAGQSSRRKEKKNIQSREECLSVGDIGTR